VTACCVSEFLLDIETLGSDPFADRIIAVVHRVAEKQKVLSGGEQEVLKAFAKAPQKADLVGGFNI
jgi:uncharacterized protein YprB with RNaseH-like and TPR domain